MASSASLAHSTTPVGIEYHTVQKIRKRMSLVFSQADIFHFMCFEAYPMLVFSAFFSFSKQFNFDGLHY
jgi:hypothetical protein